MNVKKIRVRAEMILCESDNQIAFGSLIIDEAIKIEQVRLMKRKEDGKAYLSWPGIQKNGKYESTCFTADQECYEICLEEAVKAAAYAASRRTMPEASVQITLLNKESLLGLATVRYGYMIICNIRIIQGECGPFIAFPARKNKQGEYVEVCHPIGREVRQDISDLVLKEYYQQKKVQKNEMVMR